MDIISNNTILYCDDWQACVHFYGEVLGFRKTFQRENWFVEFRVNDQSRISVADAAHCTITPGRGIGLTLSWQVGALEPLRRMLVDAGVKVSDIRRHSWRAPWFYAWDPAGHRIEFWTLAGNDAA